jgi:putative polyhydroxyalkanoate system protein
MTAPVGSAPPEDFRPMSKTIEIDIPHSLGHAEARRRIDGGFTRLSQQLSSGSTCPATHAWRGDRMDFGASVLHQSVTGRLDVLDDFVHIEVDLPAVLSVFSSRISGRLQRQGQLLLD